MYVFWLFCLVCVFFDDFLFLSISLFLPFSRGVFLFYNYQKIFIPALKTIIHWWWVQLYLREFISNFLGLDLF